MKRNTPRLSAQVKFRTLMASDHKNRGKRVEGSGKQIQLQHQIGGSLNPQWAEWFMGYPIEWTALDALEIQWFRLLRKRPLSD